MLQVFLVDIGSMLAFDMNLTFQTVAQLKEVIEQVYKIPVEKQVLMINGGECLDSAAHVFTYSAGTDTNPIFLFSTSTIECAEPPSPSIELGSDAELEEQLGSALALPPLYTTIVTRCNLAQHFHDFANEEAQACERLVHEQHLQQQGWAAVVANLEDISSAFKTKAEVFLHNLETYLQSRKQYLDALKGFTSDIELLGRIPVLEPLLRANKDKMESGVTDQHSVSLRQWICSKDHQNSLEVVAEHCRKGLEQFQSSTYKTLESEIMNTLQTVDYQSMKEIKGLGERLYGLDQLMSEARKIVTQQAETAQAFSQNKMRAANIGDMSILPDLCASHRDQLKVMLMKHKQLRDVHRRCLQAKIELAKNLHVRLRWIMVVERRLRDSDNSLVIYHESLKRLKRNLEIVQQIHLAPSVYLRSVIEVVRRRAFSKEFLKWSKVLSHQAADLHSKEMSIRREFTSWVGHHFLYSLFPGMNDSPPPYALETPEEFDAELPDIQPADVEALKALLPDMAASLSVPEVGLMPNVAMSSLDPTTCSPPACNLNQVPMPIPSYFVDSKSNVEPLSGRDCYLSALTNVQSVIDAAHVGQEKVQKMEPALGDLLQESPRDERDPDESEPDTEEFEKVDGGVAVNDAGEVREEETSQSRQHLQDLDNRLRQMQQLENEAIHTLRNDVSAARQLVLQTRDDFVSYLVTVSAQLTDVIGLVQHREDSDRDHVLRETLLKVKLEHQTAVDNLSQQLEIESQNLKFAHSEIQRVQDQLQKSNELVEKVRQEAEDRFETQKQQILAEHYETVKKMTLEHELEMEGFREEHRKECSILESGLREAQEDLSNKIENLNTLKHAQSLGESLFSKRLQEEMDKLTDRLQEDFLLREQFSIAKSLEETKQTYEEEIKWLRQKNKDLSDACDQKVEQISCLAKEFETKADQQFKELRETLAKEHKQEMEGLRARFRLAFNAAGMERSPSDSSLEKIERPDSADPSRIEQQVSILKAELEEKDAAILEMQQKHRKELEDLAQQSKKARSDSLKYMRTSLTAEKQVVFNEAVNKATAEKEATIQDLKLQLKILREELQDERLLNARIKLKDESFMLSLSSERSESSPVLSRPDSGNFHMVSPVMPRRSESSGLLGTSIVVSAVSEHPMEAQTEPNLEICEPSGLLGASVFVSPVSEQPPESQAMEGSITVSAAAANIPEKVSVYTCDIGDLVILLYDDRRENYIVFTASSIYHFLHHDCLELLSLSQSASGEKSKWLLAQITGKEYCQARKEQNRFRVPLGTRFYRVRAKPVPQSAMRRSQSSSKKRLSSQIGGGSL